MANGDDSTLEPGFRITLGTIYTQLQEQGRLISSMDKTLALQATENQSLRETIADNRDRLTKLESRFSGILVGLGTGIVLGVPFVIKLIWG